ncbi:MAG TPA: hypothetical protein VGE08_13830 [Steroidobacter sp.]|uniref:hypothetical protein n=1 Tax=Steroidobacter sp. TaxID=1978227 RepID=UPI002ED94825
MAQELSRLARLIITLGGFTVLAACGGGGGSIDTGTDPGSPGTPPPSGGGEQITVSGRVTFDRLQFNATLGSGLNGANPVVSPAREVVVQAVSNNSTLATTTTDADGNYSLSVPANRSMFIRVRSQMQKSGTPSWTFTVRDNTQSDAIYTLDGASFNSGTANQTRDLHAPSGWGGNGYTSKRRAAPFAILDTVYLTKQLILDAAPTATFDPLDLYWSEDNRTASDPFCPDKGDIGTSFYFSGVANDNCTQRRPLPEGIYILGDYANGNGDTDEFDAHVIAHEFGHYFEDRFSRSDSIGGSHFFGERLDMRVAFGEGWGNAFGAMALNEPVYRDSASGISRDGGFNLETGEDGEAQGWFSEASVGKILWDIFDTTSESGDNVPLGFTPIYNVMRGPQVDTDAFTSIFTFADALIEANGSFASDIRNLLSKENINGTGEFGMGETNPGGDPGFMGVYREIIGTGTVTDICSTSNASGNVDGNKLGNVRFVRFVKNNSGPVTIQATGTASSVGLDLAEDPDIVVYRRGVSQSFGLGSDGLPIGQSAAVRQETMNVTLDAGTYVLEVYDYQVIDPDVDPANRPSTPRCMSLSITGTT